ncbi:uncharacterized protein VTP21DRAFT_11440 [Calcarisporiella thermophila]|uniref:uncharacterized protein n=1 Tax=Calcarisporiella thermophila TaxID=911321 RepID=UPI0037424780
MHENALATLIKRLEIATSRLEDLALSSSGSSSSAKAPPASAGAAGSPSAAQTQLPQKVEAFDEITGGPLKNYLEASLKIGDKVAEQSKYVEDVFNAQRDFILIATQAKKPDVTSPVFAELIKPTRESLEKICEIRDLNRPSQYFNHLTVVSEGIQALGWVAVEPKPAPFVNEMKDAAQFYANRVIKEWKEKDTKHVEWAKSYMDLLAALHNYVKQCYTTGLEWNSHGQDPQSFVGRKPTASAAPAPPAGGVPPPPPPPPSFDFSEETSGSGQKSDMVAVLAELNKGEGITKGLRKVDKSEMTHKNPSLRASSVVKASTEPTKRTPPPPSPKPAALTSGKKSPPTAPTKAKAKKPARLELEGNKWVVENHEGNNSILIENTQINQSVYIFNCQNSVIQVKGKVNAVTMDSCNKCGLAIDSTVSTIDVVNSRSFQLQVFHKTPTIAVDKSDSGLIYLSEECLDCEIFTAKSSSLNVLLPGADESGDFKEVPVPEQFKSIVVNGRLVTVPVEHSG